MESPRFGKTLSDMTRAKLSLVKKGKYEGEKNPMFGKTHSVETRAKISGALSGENHPLYGAILSDETKKKMSEANGLGVNVLNTDTGEMVSYPSIRAAAGGISCSAWTVAQYLKSGKLFRGVYKISKKE